MHAALTVRVGVALSQKIYAYDAKHVPRWGNKHSAPQECNFGIQLKNHEKRFGQASSGRSTRPRKRSYQTAASSYAWGSREKRVHTGTLLYQLK